jgi:hypothetical protein
MHVRSSFVARKVLLLVAVFSVLQLGSGYRSPWRVYNSDNTWSESWEIMSSAPSRVPGSADSKQYSGRSQDDVSGERGFSAVSVKIEPGVAHQVGRLEAHPP